MNQGWNLVEVEFAIEAARESMLTGGNIFGRMLSKMASEGKYLRAHEPGMEKAEIKIGHYLFKFTQIIKEL